MFSKTLFPYFRKNTPSFDKGLIELMEEQINIMHNFRIYGHLRATSGRRQVYTLIGFHREIAYVTWPMIGKSLTASQNCRKKP